jgi:hypothetical protein
MSARIVTPQQARKRLDIPKLKPIPKNVARTVSVLLDAIHALATECDAIVGRHTKRAKARRK